MRPCARARRCPKLPSLPVVIRRGTSLHTDRAVTKGIDRELHSYERRALFNTCFVPKEEDTVDVPLPSSAGGSYPGFDHGNFQCRFDFEPGCDCTVGASPEHALLHQSALVVDRPGDRGSRSYGASLSLAQSRSTHLLVDRLSRRAIGGRSWPSLADSRAVGTRRLSRLTAKARHRTQAWSQRLRRDRVGGDTDREPGLPRGNCPAHHPAEHLQIGASSDYRPRLRR
jgi:hypothetical protein